MNEQTSEQLARLSGYHQQITCSSVMRTNAVQMDRPALLTTYIRYVPAIV